jgi:pyridinium-3,5-bisthiocarboxylic acid mononucleotide nickel chelatase
MKTAYFDCVAGASGDMILGALLDAGLPEAKLQKRLEALRLDGFELRAHTVSKQGFRATKVDVLVNDSVPARALPEIEAVVRASNLSAAIQSQALRIIRRLGEVEAGIHGTSVDEVHLHELGGVDAIVDIVATLIGIEELGVGRVVVSPLPLGRGFVRGAHGKIPLPAPATLALLKDVPIVGSDLDLELVTPTGAVLLTTLADQFGPIPAMTLTSVGYGAGSRDLPIPNVLRLLLGDEQVAGTVPSETLVELETNVDDMNPEIYDYIMERLFAAGALDVFCSPIQMKKNRPATLLRVLCRPRDTDELMAVLFSESSTLGIRQRLVSRHFLPREIITVNTPFGPIRLKLARLPDGATKAAPEYEDCRRLAAELKVPLRQVYQAAERAFASEVPDEVG